MPDSRDILKQRISKDGIDLIKRFEGFREKSAKTPSGSWVIGFGHTKLAEAGKSITLEDAEKLLRYYDLPVIETMLLDNGRTHIAQHEFDAFVSFVFNIGVQNFLDSDVLEELNNGDKISACEAMGLWYMSSVGQRIIRVDTLVRRRAAERSLFLKTSPRHAAQAPSAFVRPYARPNDFANVLPDQNASMPRISNLFRDESENTQDDAQKKIDKIDNASRVKSNAPPPPPGNSISFNTTEEQIVAVLDPASQTETDALEDDLSDIKVDQVLDDYDTHKNVDPSVISAKNDAATLMTTGLNPNLFEDRSISNAEPWPEKTDGIADDVLDNDAMEPKISTAPIKAVGRGLTRIVLSAFIMILGLVLAIFGASQSLSEDSVSYDFDLFGFTIEPLISFMIGALMFIFGAFFLSLDFFKKHQD